MPKKPEITVQEVPIFGDVRVLAATTTGPLSDEDQQKLVRLAREFADEIEAERAAGDDR